MPLSPGTRLGRYEIRSRLNVGSTDEIYLAHDLFLGRMVTLKLLPQRLTETPVLMHHFEREARIASALHRNIVTVYDQAEDAGRPLIVMEPVDGSLRDRLSRAPMTLSEAVDIASQIASALDAAHTAGIIHRDIRPENILLRGNMVRVADFGLANLRDYWDEINTPRSVVLGSSAYMSPEQNQFEDVDARTDIWSLGVVLYEMIAGHPPFEGRTPSETISLIVNNEPPPLTSQTEDVPIEIQRIVSKALRKKRDERYQLARDLLTDLRNVRELFQLQPEELPTSELSVGVAQTSEVSQLHRPRTGLISLLIAIAAVGVAAFIFAPWETIHERPLDKEIAGATTASESYLRDRYYSLAPIMVKLRDGKSVTGYDGNEIISVLTLSRASLIEGIRAPELVALKDYVKQAYPVPPVETFERINEESLDRVLITEGSKNAAFSDVFQFVARVRALTIQRRLSIDLNVSSLPDGATFDMWASSGPHRTTTTNNFVDNVYRGFYHYKVTKGGFKVIEDSLNLVDSDGRQLDCFLNESNDQDGPHPCKLR